MKGKDLNFSIFLLTFAIYFLLFVGTVWSKSPKLEPKLESVWIIQRDDLSFLGTGFITTIEGCTTLAAFVSNKHVLHGKSHILLRINKSPSTLIAGERDFIRVRVDLAPPNSIQTYSSYYFTSDSAHFAASYYEHPNDSVDVACFLIPSWRIFPNTVLPAPSNIKDRIELGESVFILTYPLPNSMSYLYGKNRNLPIVRRGCVARILNEPLPFKNNRFCKDVLLIDAQIFGGNSGSPVILDVERETERGTVLVNSLIGMIVGHFPMFDPIEEAVIRRTQLDTIDVSEQNYGIAVVQQSDKIVETLKLIPAFNLQK